MATVNTITGDQVVQGTLTVSGGINGQRRTGITEDSAQSFELPIQTWRIWDEFARALPDLATSSALVVATGQYDPNSADSTFFTANRDYRVVGITGRVEVAGTDGSAVTAAIKKAASATDIASGTALHSSTMNLKGSVDTNQALTISTTVSDLYIAAGTSIGIDVTGTMTAARGVVSVYLVPVSSDDLTVTQGAFGTGLGYISSGDVKALGSVIKYARTLFTVPPEYKAGSTAQLRFACGMVTTAADTSATIDAEIYKSARSTAKTGSDLVSTSAQSINSTSFAEKTFDLNAGGLAAGDVLDIRVTIATNDSATVTAVIGAIAHSEMLLTIQG